MRPTRPTDRLLAFWSNPAAEWERTLAPARQAVENAIPNWERLYGKLFRFFLDSDLTVRDMQLEMGFRRPGMVTDLFFFPKKSALRFFHAIDLFEKNLDFEMRVKIVPWEDNLAEMDVVPAMVKLLASGPLQPLTPTESRAMTLAKHLPHSMAVAEYASKQGIRLRNVFDY